MAYPGLPFERRCKPFIQARLYVEAPYRRYFESRQHSSAKRTTPLALTVTLDWGGGEGDVEDRVYLKGKVWGMPERRGYTLPQVYHTPPIRPLRYTLPLPSGTTPYPFHLRYTLP